MGTLSHHLDDLRAIIARWLRGHPWKELEKTFSSIGLTWRPDLIGQHSGKEKYVSAALDEESQSALKQAARTILSGAPSYLSHELQDTLWWAEANGEQRITEVTRRTLIEELPTRISGNLSADAFQQRLGLATFETEITDTMRILFGESRTDMRSGTTHDLITWGFYTWPDRRLFLALETIVHPTIHKHAQQKEIAQIINRVIQVDGYTLREGEPISGHPTYQVHEVATGVKGKPKNIIFASNGPKPLLGFADALNNDITILEHEASCLIYSDPLGSDGLTWTALGKWWARENGIATLQEGLKKLSSRLLESIKSSQGQGKIYRTYLKELKPLLGEKLPALLPEVYHVYDPKASAERGGRPAFKTQRMDFLLLLSSAKRVVIEVDGKQHYSTKGGQADPEAYTNTVQGDRELRLRGYEVYRFSHHELMAADGEQIIYSFFERLFCRHNLLD